MSLQFCPKCKKEEFTWHVDNDPQTGKEITTWGCGNCPYVATEDESLERTCKYCNQNTQSQLVDSNKSYWWCSSCNKTEVS